MKHPILLEKQGNTLRLSVKETSCMFDNLAWLCSDYHKADGVEAFTCAPERLARAIQCFRVANISQARRGRKLWKDSPFSFLIVSRHHSSVINASCHNVGEHQDHSNNPWEGYRPGIAKHFDA